MSIELQSKVPFNLLLLYDEHVYLQPKKSILNVKS